VADLLADVRDGADEHAFVDVDDLNDVGAGEIEPACSNIDRRKAPFAGAAERDGLENLERRPC
jgi:hypothetical protein